MHVEQTASQMSTLDWMGNKDMPYMITKPRCNHHHMGAVAVVYNLLQNNRCMMVECKLMDRENYNYNVANEP